MKVYVAPAKYGLNMKNLGHVEDCYFTKIKPRMLISKKWLFYRIPMKNWGVYLLCREHLGPNISPVVPERWCPPSDVNVGLQSHGN